MPYVVSYRPVKNDKPSLNQVLFSEANELAHHRIRNYPGTVTRYYDAVPQYLYSVDDIMRMLNSVSELTKSSGWIPSNMMNEYRVFNIPKRSGGVRMICSPLPNLYAKQVKLRSLFEKDFYALYHTAAFAYCKGRNIKKCIARHQANESKWFLKLDFEDFFGNTNKDFVMRQLAQIAPFSEVMKHETGKETLSKAIEICFLNGKLPQGTPISPLITNLVMIPFDHEINKILHQKGFVYTRYADDIQISHKEKFCPKEIIDVINSVLRDKNMPYRIKTSKTRFGSSSGRNWNLGLMLNNQNRITIGHEEHKRMKARLHSFVMDELNNKPWKLEEVQKLCGQFSYFDSIEHANAKYIIYKLDKKYHVDTKKMMHNAIVRGYDAVFEF